MDIEGITPVIPVEDVSLATQRWSALLGVEPTFVDGERWSQFDLDGRRLSLAGPLEGILVPSIMLKVSDLNAAAARARELGLQVGEIEIGEHEFRCRIHGTDGAGAILYTARTEPR